MRARFYLLGVVLILGVCWALALLSPKP